MLTYIERKTPDYEIKFGDEIKVKFIKTGRAWMVTSYRFAKDLEDLKDILITEPDFKEQAKKLLDWIEKYENEIN